jgi:mono/diheme cytochrome c family protein
VEIMRFIAIAAAAALLFSGALAQAQEQKAPAGDAAKGKATFLADGCYECHGTVGQGSRATGPRLSRTALPFVAFLAYIRAPGGEMPPYVAAVVPDQDAANMYAYLQSLPEPKPVKDIPLLNQ